MATFEASHEKLGVIPQIVIGLAELAKFGYGVYSEEQMRQQNNKIVNSGVAEMNQRIIDQSVDRALAGQQSDSAKSKTTTYIAIGAAALISLIALTK